MTTKFNSVMTETADEVLGKHRQKKQPWVTGKILEMCDKRRELKKTKNTTPGAEAYRDISKKIRKGMKNAKEDWIQKLCAVVEENLNNNNSKKALAYDRKRWRTLVHRSSMQCPYDPGGLRDS